MKKTRKLIPALAMLLISAVLMSTASYAWFSMNDQVTAQGMQITAESNKTFLLISSVGPADGQNEAQHAAAIQAVPDSRVANAVAPKNIAVYPAAVVGLTTDKGDVLNGKTAPTNDSTLDFYYAIGQGYDVHTAQDNTATIITDENLGSYVVKYTFYITVATGAAPASKIVVDSVTINGAPAVNVAVATEYAFINLDGVNNTGLKEVSISGAESNLIDDKTVLPVYVYVYYNGTHETVKTSNAANLNDTTVSLTFSVAGAGK